MLGKPASVNLKIGLRRKAHTTFTKAHGPIPHDQFKLLELGISIARAQESRSTTMHQYPIKRIPVFFLKRSNSGFAVFLHSEVNILESKFSNPSISNAALLISYMPGSQMSVIPNGN